MPVVSVVDIFQLERFAEVPLQCPGCGADFTDDNLALVERDETSLNAYRGSIAADGAFEYGLYQSEYGDGVDTVSYRCYKCSADLASGQVTSAHFPKDASTAEMQIAQAEMLLKAARDLLKKADCPKTVERVRLALSSIQGAARSASHRKYRDERRAQKVDAKKVQWAEPEKR